MWAGTDMTINKGWLLGVAVGFLTSPALAASPSPLFNWTGCYVGGQVGYGSAREHWYYGYWDGTDYNLDMGKHNADGFLGGAAVGCNYQTGLWVFGLEGDFNWGNLTGSNLDPVYYSYRQSTKLDWISTVTGRVGYAVDKSLFYFKGGVAWDRGSYDMGYGGLSYSDKITRTGWVVGAGWEYGLTANWSLKLEYNFIQFGKDDVWWNYRYASPADPWSYHVDQHIDVVKIGFNYRFGSQ
jgi:outer membrane immunogenic protein